MPVVYVDLEHLSALADRRSREQHEARTGRAQGRLAAAAGEDCVVMRYDDVDQDSVNRRGASAVVISGSTADWGRYDAQALGGLVDLVREPPVPVLGICAGHQLIGWAHGAQWGPMGALAGGEADPCSKFAPGMLKERGFLGVDLDRGCALFRGLGLRELFFQSHHWHLLNAPAGFAVRASSGATAIQAIEDPRRRLYGVQFHPERYSEENPAGCAVLEAFFALRLS